MIYSLDRLTTEAFASAMTVELMANETKGQWKDWNPTPDEALRELERHVDKLKASISDQAATLECAADIANISMKVYERALQQWAVPEGPGVRLAVEQEKPRQLCPE
jgi:hypothetical protein